MDLKTRGLLTVLALELELALALAPEVRECHDVMPQPMGHVIMMADQSHQRVNQSSKYLTFF